MRVRRVNRYYCDFCKKPGCSARHIQRHEAACTMNPARVCGVCTKMLKQEQPELAGLMALLPNPKEFLRDDDWGIGMSYVGLEEAVEAAMPALREAVGLCPTCIMAALRQKGIPATMAHGLKVKEELEAIWRDINEDHMEYGY